VNGGRPGIDGFALDHFCLETCRGQELCKRHAQVNLPNDLYSDKHATWHTHTHTVTGMRMTCASCGKSVMHTASAATFSHASAKEPVTRSRALFADAFSRTRARQCPTRSRTLNEAHRVDRRSNAHQGFELLSRLKPSCHVVVQTRYAHLSDGHSPVVDPVVGPPGRWHIRSCAGCRRRRPRHACFVLPPHCQARAQIAGACHLTLGPPACSAENRPAQCGLVPAS
jgi:hypothetical protein